MKLAVMFSLFLLAACGGDSNSSIFSLSSLESNTIEISSKVRSFKYRDSSDEFRAWNNDFVIGGTLLAYIHMPMLSPEERKRRLVSSMEEVSMLENMKFGNGAYMFDKTSQLSEDGYQVEDDINGIIEDGFVSTDMIFFLSPMPVIGSLTVDATATMEENEDSIVLDFRNTENIPILIFRRFIRPSDIRLTFVYTPIEDGYLVKGKASLKIHALQGRANPKTLEDILTTFHEVITRNAFEDDYEQER